MLVGAVLGFAVGHATGSTMLGRARRDRRRRGACGGLRLSDPDPAVQPDRGRPGADDLRPRLQRADGRRLCRHRRADAAEARHAGPVASSVARPGPVRPGHAGLCLVRAPGRRSPGSSTAPMPGWCCARSAIRTMRRMRSAIRVVRIRYAAVLFGGAMAGLAGGYMSLAYSPLWAEDMTAGRGWIALALVVFAAWRPARLLGGAYLFGGDHVSGALCAGAGRADPVALPLVAALSRDRRRARRSSRATAAASGSTSRPASASPSTQRLECLGN